MNLKEAEKILKSGEFWKYLKDDIPQKAKQDFADAVDIAVVCVDSLNRLTSVLDTMDRLDKGHDANVAHEDPYTGDKAPIVTGDESCAECLCRVCARNVNNDSSNPDVEFEYKDCEACENCKIGETHIVDVDTDCPALRFLPDMDDFHEV